MAPPIGRRALPRGPRAEVARRLPARLAGRVPRYERLGEVVLLKLPGDLLPERGRLGAAFGEAFRAKAVLLERGVRGPRREPDTELLWGGDARTVHVEDGIRFALDPSRVMFASGNLAERMRMGRLVRPGETVVDLFAGIGQFALPMAIHGRARRVVACEVNPVAHGFLRENVRLNRAWAVEPRLGDCREVAPEGVADRVVMGYLRGEAYLDVAMRTARDSSVLHYHEATPVESVPDRPWRRVAASAAAAGRTAELLAVRRVKSYAPCIQHVVLDVRLTR